MLLAIDVGNTNIVLGVFERTELIRSWRLQTLRERTSDELGLLVKGLFDNFKIDGYIDPAVVTSGTDLLGDSSDLFGLVTASYSF